MSHRSIRPLHLRPRAGLAATALLIAGLTVSGAAAFLGADLVEPASAGTAGTHDGGHRPAAGEPGPGATAR